MQTFAVLPWLAACQSPPRRLAARGRPATFALEGRVSVRQGEERHHGGIVWRHAPGVDSILLTNPLGQGVAELERDAAGARLMTADRQSHVAPDWEALSAKVFGFALPLSGLPRWVVADVTPTARDGRGRPVSADADGWRIEYLRYADDAGDALPDLIELRRDDIEIRLKVDTWGTE